MKRIFFLVLGAFSLACGAPPSYEGRKVGDDFETDNSAAGASSADAGEPSVPPMGTGGSAGSAPAAGNGGDSGSGTASTGGAGNATAGAANSSGGNAGAAGAPPSSSGGATAGTSSTGGAGTGSTPPREPTYLYLELSLPDVTAEELGDAGLEQWRFAGECAGMTGSLEELAGMSMREASDRPAGYSGLGWNWNRWIAAAWARVEVIRWHQNCQTEDSPSDEELVASLCPGDLSFGACIETADPRDFTSGGVAPSAVLGLADLACYNKAGSARVSAAQAVDKFGQLAGALEAPTSDQQAAFDLTVQMTGLGGKNVAKAYALVTSAVYAFSCLARQAE